jgi:hypothetical protein
VTALRVKHLIGTCGLETLFFFPCPFICIVNDTCGIEKDGIGTSISFSVQILTACHVSTPKS